MTWFYLSLAHAVITSFVWLSLKRSQDKGLTSESALFSYSIFLILGLLGWHLITLTPIVLPGVTWIGFLFLAGLAAAASNLLLMSSFERSLNPGLSLAISETKALWLAVIGVLFLGSSLSFLAGMGIFVLLAGVALMHFRNKTTDFKWESLALAAALTGTIYWLIVKVAEQNVPDLAITTILILVFVPQLIFIWFFRHSKLQAEKLLTRPVLIGLGLAGLIGALGNFVSVKAVLAAPNPGYSLAVSSSSVVITLLASWFLFNASVYKRQAIAVLIITIGVIIIRLGSI